jgi:hypothetical protein
MRWERIWKKTKIIGMVRHIFPVKIMTDQKTTEIGIFLMFG